MNELTSKHVEEVRKHEAEAKVAHAALAKLVNEATDKDEDDDVDVETMGRRARADLTQGGGHPR